MDHIPNDFQSMIICAASQLDEQKGYETTPHNANNPPHNKHANPKLPRQTLLPSNHIYQYQDVYQDNQLAFVSALGWIYRLHPFGQYIHL